MLKKPVILHTTIAAKTRFFEIESLHLRFNNGAERHFERLKATAHNAVMMVPLWDAHTILLVREYAAGIGEYLLGFPKGVIEKNEEAVDAANRELMEEIGYGANKLTVLKSTTTSPGYMDRRMEIILAESLYPQRLPGDEPEPLEVVSWSLSDYKTLLARDDFNEARSIAALYLIRDWLAERHT